MVTHAEQKPEIGRPPIRVSATPFIAQHRNGASDHGRKAEHDMHADNRQEERIGGWDRDALTVVLSFVMTAYNGMRLWSLTPHHNSLI